MKTIQKKTQSGFVESVVRRIVHDRISKLAAAQSTYERAYLFADAGLDPWTKTTGACCRDIRPPEFRRRSGKENPSPSPLPLVRSAVTRSATSSKDAVAPRPAFRLYAGTHCGAVTAVCRVTSSWPRACHSVTSPSPQVLGLLPRSVGAPTCRASLCVR